MSARAMHMYVCLVCADVPIHMLECAMYLSVCGVLVCLHPYLCVVCAQVCVIHGGVCDVRVCVLCACIHVCV